MRLPFTGKQRVVVKEYHGWFMGERRFKGDAKSMGKKGYAVASVNIYRNGNDRVYVVAYNYVGGR